MLGVGQATVGRDLRPEPNDSPPAQDPKRDALPEELFEPNGSPTPDGPPEPACTLPKVSNALGTSPVAETDTCVRFAEAPNCHRVYPIAQTVQVCHLVRIRCPLPPISRRRWRSSFGTFLPSQACEPSYWFAPTSASPSRTPICPQDAPGPRFRHGGQPRGPSLSRFCPGFPPHFDVG